MSYKSIHSGPAIDKAISTVNNDLMDNTQYDSQGTFKAEDLGNNEDDATVLFDKFNCEHGDNVNIDIRYYSNLANIDYTKSFNFSVNNNAKTFNSFYLLNSSIEICIYKNTIYAYVIGEYLQSYGYKLDIKIKNASNPKYRLSSTILPTTVITTEKQSLLEEQQMTALGNLDLIETKYNRSSNEYSFNGYDIENVNYTICAVDTSYNNNMYIGVQLHYKSSNGLIQTIITKYIKVNNNTRDYTVFYTNSDGYTVSLCAYQGRLWAMSNSASFNNDKFGVIIVSTFSTYAVSESKLPNSVIKTTPQKLFKSEKEQALTNLGIERINSLLLPTKIGFTEGVSTAQFTIESSPSEDIPCLEVNKGHIFTNSSYYNESTAAKISNIPNPSTGDSFTYTALEVDARDVAIKATHGQFAGLRPALMKHLDIYKTYLTELDHTIISVFGSGDRYLYLPKNPENGQYYRIIKYGQHVLHVDSQETSRKVTRIGVSTAIGHAFENANIGTIEVTYCAALSEWILTYTPSV